jgi:putative membrane protein
VDDSNTTPASFDPRSITRPDRALLVYFLLASLCALVAAPFVFLPLYVRYKTMRYEIDEEGISMRWGLLFRREVYLTFRRIQDIHVTRNIVERWLGLAKVHIQTASGTGGATMQIEGIRNPETLRDFLYQRMRGARGHDAPPPDQASGDDPAALLREIRDEIRRIRERLEHEA